LRMREIGTIKFWSGKGFGFIEQDHGPDIFVHYSDVEGEGYITMDRGQDVEFDVVEGPKGLQAKNVVKL